MTCAMKNWDACALAKNRSNGGGVGGIRGPLSYSLPQRAVSAPHPSRTPTPPSRQNLPAANGLSKSLNGGRVAPQNYGPELLLTPLREILTNRDDSPIQRRVSIHNNSQQHQQSSAYAYSIPISDVMIVDTANPHSQTATTTSPGRKSLARHNGSAHSMSQSSSSSCQIFITTFSYGLLDFQCQHQNGLDILMAFLKASLPPERILDRAKYLQQNPSSYDESSSLDSIATASDNDDPGKPRDANAHRRRGRRKSKGGAGGRGGPTIRSSSSVTSCLDVDTFTAVHLKGRAEHETWPEKMTRRVGHVVNSLSDLSSACCDGSWCLASSSAASLPVDDDERDDHHRQQSHPQTASSSSSLRQIPTQQQAASLRHGSAMASAVVPASAASNNFNNGGRQPSPPKQPHSSDAASRKFGGYSDLELDEQESLLPGGGGGAAAAGASESANPSAAGSDAAPPSAKVDRRWSSMPNARRLELLRKSSC
jgi:hypothetical protein